MTAHLGFAGDPASVSALGGALRRQALLLAELAADLERAASRPSPTHHPDPSAHERELVARCAHELDVIGALLQSFMTTTVDTMARTRALEVEAERTDLAVAGHHVVEAAGPRRADPTDRLRDLERLQELLNRVTSIQAKERARVRRDLERSSATLASVSARARAGGGCPDRTSVP